MRRECTYILFWVRCLTADYETLKDDVSLKAWEEKVTPRKGSSRPLRQRSEGLEEAWTAQKRKDSPESYVGCMRPWMEAPHALAGWARCLAIPRGMALCRVPRDTEGHGIVPCATVCSTHSRPRIHWFPIHGIRMSLGVSVLLEG